MDIIDTPYHAYGVSGIATTSVRLTLIEACGVSWYFSPPIVKERPAKLGVSDVTQTGGALWEYNERYWTCICSK